MNHGAGAGRDDDDLPLVDVVVPDDARELFRDVLAYHRERRATRRRELRRRLLGPMRRRGILLSLTSGVMLLALVTGFVLSLVSSGPYLTGKAVSTASTGTAHHGTSTKPAGTPARSASAGGLRLPAATISAGGQVIKLGSLTSVALALIPVQCGCTETLRRLITQAKQADVRIYLIGQPGAQAGLNLLAGQGWPAGAIVATDPANGLGIAFRPAGLTVLLVDSGGNVTVSRDFGLASQLGTPLSSLLRAG